jgi:flagellin-like protein
MKTLRKIRKNAKALSPVVASIILIAVTVAVSIAVAAWMGALTFQFTAVEELQMPPSTEVSYSDTTISLTVKNTGTSPVTIVAVRVNGADPSGVTVDLVALDDGATIQPADDANLVITLAEVSAGTKYRIELVTSSNKQFFQDYTATSPIA